MAHLFYEHCRHYLQGDVLQEKVHRAVTVVFEQLKSQKEPIDPEGYITFIVGFILMGVSYNTKLVFREHSEA